MFDEKSACFQSFFYVSLTGCSHFQRSAESGYDEAAKYSEDGSRRGGMDSQTQKTAYELGKDPNSLSGSDMNDIRSRQKVRDLERTLNF